jgi:hypothetical protein
MVCQLMPIEVQGNGQCRAVSETMVSAMCSPEADCAPYMFADQLVPQQS